MRPGEDRGLTDLGEAYPAWITIVYIARDNNTLCIIILSLKAENHKSQPAIARMTKRKQKQKKTYTAQAC